jgi:hypothetical protein
MWGAHIKYSTQLMGYCYIDVWILNFGKVKQGGEGAYEVVSPKALKKATIQYNEDGDPIIIWLRMNKMSCKKLHHYLIIL